MVHHVGLVVTGASAEPGDVDSGEVEAPDRQAVQCRGGDVAERHRTMQLQVYGPDVCEVPTHVVEIVVVM